MVLGLVLSAFLTLYATIAAMAAAVVWLALNKRLIPLVRNTPKAVYLAALCGLNFVVSLYYFNLKGMVFGVGLAVIVLLAVYIRQVMTPRLFETALELACAASIISVLVIAIQLLVSPGSLEIRPASTFINANYYATVTEFILFFCLHKLRPGADAGKRYFYLAVLILNLAGLYMSGCRTAILALLIGVPFYLVLSRRYKDLLTMAFVGAMFIVIISQFDAVQDRISSIWADILDRVSIWKIAIRGFLDHPLFGQGMFSYELASSRHTGPVRDHAHSLFLDPLLNYGFLGTTLILAYLRENLRSIFRLSDRREHVPVFWMTAGFLMTAALHGITDQTLISVQSGLLFAFVLATAGLADPATAAETVAVPVGAARKTSDKPYSSAADIDQLRK